MVQKSTATSNGWVKLHRDILDWGWYSDHNTSRLFIHLLIRANHKRKEWCGIWIESGTFITSYSNMAKECGLSVQQTRTSLNKLKSTGEITIKTTNKYTMIEVNNWEGYQVGNTQDNNQITIKQQTNNNKQERKNEKKPTTDEGFEVAWSLYERKGNKQSALKMWEKLKPSDKNSIVERIPAYLADRPEVQYRADFSTWINPSKRRWEDKLKVELSQSGRRIVAEELDGGQFRVEIVGATSRMEKNILVGRDMLDKNLKSGVWIK